MQHARTGYSSDSSASFEAIGGFLFATLATLGVGAIAYLLVAPGGLLARVFERNLAGGLAVMLALLMVGLCAWLTRKVLAEGGP